MKKPKCRVLAINILKEADKALSDESKWTKGTMFRTNRAGPIAASGLQLTEMIAGNVICSMCLVGALKYGLNVVVGANAVGKGKMTLDISKADHLIIYTTNKLVEEITGKDMLIHNYNDLMSTTFSDVKAVLAKSIERLENAT